MEIRAQLYDVMGKFPGILGRFKGAGGQTKRQKQWKQIAQMMEQRTGLHLSSKQWEKKWQDLKCLARKAVLMEKTGVNPDVHPLYRMVIHFIEKNAVKGAEESEVVDDPLETGSLEEMLIEVPPDLVSPASPALSVPRQLTPSPCPSEMISGDDDEVSRDVSPAQGKRQKMNAPSPSQNNLAFKDYISAMLAAATVDRAATAQYRKEKLKLLRKNNSLLADNLGFLRRLCESIPPTLIQEM